MNAGPSRNAHRFVLRREADQVVAAFEQELRRGLRRMGAELAPRLAMKSHAEIRWIYQRAVVEFCDRMEAMGRAAINSMPGVSPPDDQRRGRDQP